MLLINKTAYFKIDLIYRNALSTSIFFWNKSNASFFITAGKREGKYILACFVIYVFY